MIENNRFNFSSVLTDDLKRKYDEFIIDCERVSCPVLVEKIGRYSFVVTPTSIGTVFEVEDRVTKKSIDLTDYSTW
jgi:hypothetical protein